MHNATPREKSLNKLRISLRSPLDVSKNGDVVWKTYTIPDAPRLLRTYADGTELRGPSGGAIWSAPTIDVRRGVLYVGVGNAYTGPAPATTDAVGAFDLKTGRERRVGADGIYRSKVFPGLWIDPRAAFERMFGARDAQGRATDDP